jgi:hypothetical protein
VLAFRDTPPDGDPPAQGAPRVVLEAREGGAILACSFCRTPVTSRAAAIAVGGQHEHSCENPHGYTYVIGCFAAAQGLVAVGVPTQEWTWFPGYSWQVQHCAACEQLMGWRYQSADGGFYGLIVRHLVDVLVDDA